MKKETFYKTMRNQNGKGYHLEPAEGYKKTYTDETHAQITLYFDNIGGFWGATENETGASVISGFYETLKEAKEKANEIIKALFTRWNSPDIQQAKRIKFDLLCQL